MSYLDGKGTAVKPKSGSATWARAAMTANIAGAVGDVATAWAQAKRQKAAAKYNAMYAQRAAEDAMYRGRMEQLSLGLKQAQMKGAQRTALAANNIAFDSPTAVDLQAGTDLIARMDATNIENNARREAWAYRAQAANYTAQAEFMSPAFSAGSSLLEGATRVASKWYENNQVFGSNWSKNWFTRG